MREGAEEHAWIEVYPDHWFGTGEEGRGDGTFVSALAASALAGARADVRETKRLQQELHEATGQELRASGWSQIVPGLRKEEWLGLLEEEKVSWRRAAEILRTLEIGFGRLTLPVCDHARWPKRLEGSESG